MHEVTHTDAIHLNAIDASNENGAAWYVYLLPLYGSTVFKIGFTCCPLQRISSFNRRYYERFDLSQATFLEVEDLRQARRTEAKLKNTFAGFRATCPEWVAAAAGGHTEWFDSQQLSPALSVLGSFCMSNSSVRLIEASEFICAELVRMSPTFELWAVEQAKLIRNDIVSVELGYPPQVNRSLLRDWLDAYRFFNLTLFPDDHAALEFVSDSVRR